jgi:hypothetical protein
MNHREHDDMKDARHIGADRVAAEAAEASGEGPMEAPQPLTADEAIAAAAAEGLVRARKDGTPFGFWGVSKRGHKFKASVRGLPGARRLHLRLHESIQLRPPDSLKWRQ